MAEETPKVQIVVRSQLRKYAEGADPAVDQPFEVLEHEQVLEGEEARKFLMGVGDNATDQRGA